MLIIAKIRNLNTSKSIQIHQMSSDQIESLSSDNSEGTKIVTAEAEAVNPNLNPNPNDETSEAFNKIDPAVMKKLNEGYNRLRASDNEECSSLLKKHLYPELFDKLKVLQTSYGSTLLDVIQSGLENLDSTIGVYAPDPEAYNIFSELFDPIIEEYHEGFKRNQPHPSRDLGDIRYFKHLDFSNSIVTSIRLRTSRNLVGYPLHPLLTEVQYIKIETKIRESLLALPVEFKGQYYPLGGMPQETQDLLNKRHFLFQEGDRFLKSANANRFWPIGRAVFHNVDNTFLVWVNGEDHFRMISMQTGGDLSAVYRRFVTAIKNMEKRLTFSHCENLGYLTFYPINLGTTIRASVHIKIPKLATRKDTLEEIMAKYDLEIHASRISTKNDGPGHFVVTNKHRLGLTEFQTMKAIQECILDIVNVEAAL